MASPIAKLALVTAMVQSALIVTPMMDSAVAETIMEDGIARSVRMVTTGTQPANCVTVIQLVLPQKSVTRTMDSVCASQALEDPDVTDVPLAFTDILIVQNVVVSLLDLFVMFAMKVANVFVILTMLEEPANPVLLDIIAIQTVSVVTVTVMDHMECLVTKSVDSVLAGKHLRE